MKKNVYVVCAEVTPKPGSQLWGKARGALVNGFFFAGDARFAIDAVVQALSEDLYEIVRIEWVMPFSETNWEDEQAEHEALSAEAQESGEVVYSDFFTYIMSAVSDDTSTDE
jgi:hypothetical protein